MFLKAHDLNFHEISKFRADGSAKVPRSRSPDEPNHENHGFFCPKPGNYHISSFRRSWAKGPIKVSGYFADRDRRWRGEAYGGVDRVPKSEISEIRLRENGRKKLRKNIFD